MEAPFNELCLMQDLRLHSSSAVATPVEAVASTSSPCCAPFHSLLCGNNEKVFPCYFSPPHSVFFRLFKKSLKNKWKFALYSFYLCPFIRPFRTPTIIYLILAMWEMSHNWQLIIEIHYFGRICKLLLPCEGKSQWKFMPAKLFRLYFCYCHVNYVNIFEHWF